MYVKFNKIIAVLVTTESSGRTHRVATYNYILTFGELIVPFKLNSI